MNNKGLLLALLFIPATWICFGQACENYYAFSNGYSGSTLKTILHNVIAKNHIRFDFLDNESLSWKILGESDRDPLHRDSVFLFYTGWKVKTDGTDIKGNRLWHREHVWSVSHIDGTYTSTPACDLHNLKPIHDKVNSSRGNEDFDNGGEPVSLDDCPITNCFSDKDSWEPRNEDKGDVARILFYMAVRYEGDDGNPDLELFDTVNTDTLIIPGKEFHGKLSTLLEWHHADPVDKFESNRNEVIYQYQHNRNPFIDHPEFADMIWGKNNVREWPGSLLVLYPVPASEVVNVIWSGKNLVQGTLTNSWGGTEIKFEFSGYKTLDVSRLEPGIYFISVTDGENSEGKKVVVKP